MASKDEREFDSGLTGGTDVPALEEDFSLEEILAEYGAGREQRLMEAVEQEARRETEPAAPPAEGGAKKPPLQTEARPRPAPQVTEKTAPPQKPPAQPEDLLEELRQDLPPSPHPITLEDVVGSTVDVLYHSHCYGGQHCHDTPRYPGPGNRLAHALRCGAGLCHSKG